MVLDAVKELLAMPPPPTLYHYTSQTGLMGILRNGTLWASEVKYLNDSKEYIHAIELAAGTLANRLVTTKEEPERLLIGKLIEQARGAASSPTKAQSLSGSSAGIYVTSLSEDGDLLSQWITYSPRSGGYAVGFDTKRLMTVVRDQGFALVPCIYDVQLQKQIVDQLIDTVLSSFRSRVEKAAGQTGTEGFLAQVMAVANRALGPFLARVDFWLNIALIAPILKHPSFRAEREWRLVSGSLNRVLKALSEPDKPPAASKPTGTTLERKFREGSTCLVPYVEVKLIAQSAARAPVTRVVVGPTPLPELARASASSYASGLGYTNLQLAISESTYRVY